MNSLSELKDFFVNNQIQIKSFDGWQLKVGKDLWTMHDGVYYRNNLPQSLKDKTLFDSYKKVTDNVKHQSTQTRKWRVINCRNRRG